MHREGHVGIGLVLYAPIAHVLVASDLTTAFYAGLLGMCVWSLAPDVDALLPIRHRGPTHSVVATIAAGLVTAIVALYAASSGSPVSQVFHVGPWIAPREAVSLFGFVVGVLGVGGHLLGDVLTPMGIRPWWPFSEREHGLGLVQSADEDANTTLLLAGVLAVTVAVATAYVR